MIAFALFGATVWLHALPAGEFPDDLIGLTDQLRPKGAIEIVEDLDSIKNRCQILYVNRLQTERRKQAISGRYGPIGALELGVLVKEGVVLHPLPRGGELDESISAQSKVRIWEHVDITYRTRQWLLNQYLNGGGKTLAGLLSDFPFVSIASCSRSDCASRSFPALTTPSTERGITSLLCRACLRPA